MYYRKYIFLIALPMLLGVLLSASTVQAQQPEFGELSVTIPAGGETSVQFNTFCLEVGKNFPAQLNKPSGRASEDVLKVLQVAIEEDMVETDPLQTQLAIWHEVEGDWAYSEDEVSRDQAQQLLDKAANITLEPINPQGVALDQAINEGSITVESNDFAATDADTPTPDDEPYQGRGTLRISNNTEEELTIYFPFGLVLEAANDSEQDMVAFATEVEQQPTATPQPTTATAEATSEVEMTTPEATAETVEATDEAEMTMPEAAAEAVADVTITPVTTTTTTVTPTTSQVLEMTPTPASPSSLPGTGAETEPSSVPLLLALGGIALVLLGLSLLLLRLRFYR